MRTTLLAVALLAGGLLALEGGYHQSSAPSETPVAANALPSLLTKVVAVCGNYGCAQVQTKRVIHHQKPGNTVPRHI